MSSDVVFSAVRQFLAVNWTGAPLTYENETFVQPRATNFPAPPAQWVELEFVGDMYQQESIGSGDPAAERWTEGGAVLAHCFVQSGAGTLAARTTARQLADLFRGLELPDRIRFRSMSIGDGGPGDDDGNWWGLTLRADWLRG
jgi:hypothetical protein